MSFSSQVLLTVLLILSSAFFAIAELSLAASRKIRLEQLAEAGDSRANQVMDLQAHPGHFFTVIQIGLNAVAILAGIIGHAAFSPYFADAFGYFLGPEIAKSTADTVAFLLVTLSFVLFADLIPKRIAMVAPETLALIVVRPMKLMILLFKPVVWVFNGISNRLLRWLGVPTQRDERITSEDIIATVDAGTAAGVLDQTEKAVIENVFDMETRLVPSAMTTRESVVYFRLSDSEEEIRRKASGTTYNVYPVCDGSLDHIVGTVSSKKLLRLAMRGDKISMRDSALVDQALFVPDSISLSDMLDFFKCKQAEFAIVINEYGLTVGVISINDVMRAVMADLVPVAPEEAQIMRRDENSWLVDGATPVDDLEKLLEIDELPHEASYETMAGFMMYILRKIPMRTDYVDCQGYRFEVIDVDHNKVSQLLVTRLIDGRMPAGSKKPEASADRQKAAAAPQPAPQADRAKADKPKAPEKPRSPEPAKE